MKHYTSTKFLLQIKINSFPRKNPKKNNLNTFLKFFLQHISFITLIC